MSETKSLDIEVIQQKILQESEFVERLMTEVGRVVVGQRTMIERLLIGLLADGHVLMEGVPGLAKTLTVNTLARAIDTKFRRLQFTPDLLPADLTGTLIYDPYFVVNQSYRTQFREISYKCLANGAIHSIDWTISCVSCVPDLAIDFDLHCGF